MASQDTPYAHTHGTPGETDEQTLAVQLANQFINSANTRLEQGVPARVVAAGMRHAAANFSAFAAVTNDPSQLEDTQLIDEFAAMLDYYAERHQTPSQPVTGLHDLVSRVKDEF